MAEIFSYIENFHTKFEQGVIDQDEWDRQQQVLLFYLQWPGTERWWKRSDRIFRPSFRTIVDKALVDFASGAVPRPAESLSMELSSPPT